MARWYLESNGRGDDIELREASDGSLELRHHYTLVRKQKLGPGASYNSQAGQVKGTMQYFVGSRFYSFSHTGRKYLCVQDDEGPEAEPGDIRIRVQVWEHFSAWSAAPSLGNG